MDANSSWSGAGYWPLDRRESKCQGILTVLGAFILMTYLGCFYLWGNISIYVVSYFYHLEPNVSYSFIFMVNTLLNLSKWLGF